MGEQSGRIHGHHAKLKTGEEALRESEARFRALADNIAQLTWMADATGAIFYYNQRWHNYTGATLEEMQGWGWEKVHHPDHVQRVVRKWKTHLKQGKAWEDTFPLRGKDGTYRWFLSRAFPLRDTDGKITRWFGTNTDVTEMRTVQEALRAADKKLLHHAANLEQMVAKRTAQLTKSLGQLRTYQAELEMQNEELHRIQFDLESSRDRFAQLYNQAPIGYLTLDHNGLVHEANLTAARLVGLDPHGLVKKRLSQFVAVESQDELYFHLQDVFRARSKQTCELQLRPKGAPPFIGRLESVLTPPEVGQAPHCLVALSDITVQRQAEIALHESEAALADFFDESPIGLLWVAEEGRILRVNRAQREMLRRSEVEVLYHNISEFHADPELAAEILQRLACKEALKDCRMQFRTRKGTLIHVLLDANGLWEAEQLVHTRWFVRDISYRVQLEREILEIGEREKQLLGHELHDDLCQQLSSIEYLSHSLAMDLSLKSKASARRAAEIAQLLRKANARTRELSHGLIPLPPGSEGLIGALKDLARRTCTVFQRDCRFSSSKPGRINQPELRQHLYRIAQEAVGNAIKHGKATRIDLHLSRSGNRLMLEICDNGVGLRKNPGKQKEGMGLRIMHHRAAMISGSLHVQRRPGGGTIVLCSVPDSGQGKEPVTSAFH
jgi:PAS domain S-box-containing protein